MGERVKVAEAAKILGMSQQGVREHMKRGLFKNPIGEVTKMSEGRYEYHIYRSMLNKHIGRGEPDEKTGPHASQSGGPE